MFEREDILTYEVLDDPPGVEIIDQLERLRYQLTTGETVAPTPIPTDDFHFPVGSALALRTEEFSLPMVGGLYVRDETGAMLSEVNHLDEETLAEGSYILELTTQIKTYIEIEGPLEITANMLETRVAFDEQRQVRLGVRSRHQRPATTVTSPDDPVAMMDAISMFGSALKSTTPERSYPSLRGHPPAIELGSAFDVPETVERPETGISLEVPATYDAVYTVAPLAYYLGADVRQGRVPRLVTDDGFEYDLTSPGNLEAGVERTLRQLFLLDCLTKTEGLYEIDLHERNEIEPHVGLDFADLYDSSLSEQVATYLDVPYRILEEHIPKWRLTAHVEPVPETVEQLPFVVNDLAIVRIAEAFADTKTAHPKADGALTRAGGFTRSVSDSSPGDLSYVEPQSSESLEQAWIGDHIPIGASKLTKAAFQNRLDREKVAGDISITIVLNDPRMDEERDLVSEAYGDRDDLPFDVTVHRDLTVAQLREVLAGECSFLHYIGHIEDDGFRCTDGKLDASSLESTAVDSFLLNACHSYQQGLHLIEAGAVGGIVTLNELLNDGAIDIGGAVARLLNAGFPLRAALTIAREESVLGGQYIVVGDGGVTVTQLGTGVPNLLEITPADEGFEVVMQTYATDEKGLGSLFMPHIPDNDEHFLTSGRLKPFSVSPDDLQEFLQLQDVPVRHNDILDWSSSLYVSELQ